MVREGRVAGAEVHGVETTRREVGDVRPRLLRADCEVAGSLECPHRRRVDDARRPRVAQDLERRIRGNEAREERLRLFRLTVGGIAEAHGGSSLARDDVVGDSRVQLRHGDDLPELETVHDCRSWRKLEERREAPCRTFESAVREPRSSRVPARSMERDPRDHVPEAPRLDRKVGRFEHDGERRLMHQRRFVEECGQRVVLRGQLFTPEEQEGDVTRRAAELEIACQLDRDGEPTLHVARPEAVNGTVGDPAGKVVLRRHGVVMRREDDQGHVRSARWCVQERLVTGELGRPSGRHQPEQALPDGVLVPALRRDVHELERPRGKAVGERGHGRSVPRHNLAVTARQPDPAPGAEPERAFLVGLYPKGSSGADELAELRELARTSGAVPVGELVQHRGRPDPRTFVGKGKLAELKAAYSGASSEVLLVDDELTPTQQRALEDALGARVVDRTQLILDIFAQHARSSEGKLQVELAQLEYNLPRMRGMWRHLERLGGGVGTRGPGESQLETDRRLARTRVSLLKRRLDTLRSQRSTRRKERVRAATPTIALAGYTNVGKSTLLNALTGAQASVDDRLFETLDPTTRGFEHDGKRYLVTDTVGFIRRLPTTLVEGFAATLEETLVADLVLHVADASLHEQRLAETVAAVTTVLGEIGADDIPVELVLNKVDALDPLGRRRIAHTYPRALLVSAHTGEGLDALKRRIAELFSDRFEDVRLLVPYSDGRALASLYELGAPIAERRDTAEGVRVRARLPRSEAARYARYLVAEDGHELEASAR
jgi:GTPase